MRVLARIEGFLQFLVSILLTLIISSPARASGIILVPGTSDIYLAGAPLGARASGFTPGSTGVDYAPAHSPVLIEQLCTGCSYTFTAYGAVTNGPELPWCDPNGCSWLGDPTVPHYAGDENGILNLNAPVNSLIGLWAGTDQPFFIGQLATLTALSSGLYLGTMDGWEWLNNAGGFVVEWSDPNCPTTVPEPTTLMLLGVGLLGLSRRLTCKRNR